MIKFDAAPPSKGNDDKKSAGAMLGSIPEFSDNAAH
jgi:hypothetical protein